MIRAKSPEYLHISYSPYRLSLHINKRTLLLEGISIHIISTLINICYDSTIKR
jgi:hypothetical protein